MTSTVEIKDDSRGRPVQKAKVLDNITYMFCKSTFLHSIGQATLD